MTHLSARWRSTTIATAICEGNNQVAFGWSRTSNLRPSLALARAVVLGRRKERLVTLQGSRTLGS